jgi:protein kinase 1
VAIGFVAAEPIETFTSAVLNNISTSVANAAGVDPGNVTATARAASTRIDITITTPSASASAYIEGTMAATMFANASVASSVLGLRVTSAPTITSETVLTIISPATSAGLFVPDAGSGTMLTVPIVAGTVSLLGGIAAILLVIRCRRSRAKSVGRAGNTHRAFGRSRAQVGFGASTSSRTADERGAATHGIALEEDVDIVKAARPVRQADAAARPVRDLEAEATIDFVKKAVAPAFASATFENTQDPSKNNLLSSMPCDLTPRGGALNQMIIQATKSSKIQPIPWKDLEILEKLGEGTFGTVHACSFKATPCAVKQLREDRESSAALLADMLQEHDTMMGLRHPNVVLMLGIATDNVQRVGIVLELLEISLSELLHQSSGYAEHRTWRNSLLSIASDVAKGVAYLHFNNLLHRDLKPGNVLLADSWVAKVADFGSSAKGKPGSAAEGEGIHGTPPYMAPEVARGEAHSAALDVWSFGCLIVHMATLRPPYYGLKCKTAMDIVRVVRRGEVSPVQVLIDDAERRKYKCPASILALAKQCCQRDPKQRPDMPAIAGAIASPGIQNSILKGTRDMRPLVRLVRGGPRAAVASGGTIDASIITYEGSFAPTPRAETPQADANALPEPARLPAPASPRSTRAYNASKSKFRNLSKQSSAAANTNYLSARGGVGPARGGSPGSPSAAALNMAYAGSFDAATNRTFDAAPGATYAQHGATSARSDATFNNTFMSARSDATFNNTFTGTYDPSKDKASTSSINTLSVNLARASRANIAAASARSGSTSAQHCAASARVEETLKTGGIASSP